MPRSRRAVTRSRERVMYKFTAFLHAASGRRPEQLLYLARNLYMKPSPYSHPPTCCEQPGHCLPKDLAPYRSQTPLFSLLHAGA